MTVNERGRMLGSTMAQYFAQDTFLRILSDRGLLELAKSEIQDLSSDPEERVRGYIEARQKMSQPVHFSDDEILEAANAFRGMIDLVLGFIEGREKEMVQKAPDFWQERILIQKKVDYPITPNWANRTMWTGDNLDIMRDMNSECVDLIYLDPPFNLNRNYVAPVGSAAATFKDTWELDDVDLAWHGEIAEQQPALYAIIDAARLAHGGRRQGAHSTGAVAK